MWKNSLAYRCFTGLSQGISKRLIICGAIVGLTSGLAANALAATVEFTIDEAGQITNQLLEVGNNRVFLRAAGGDPSQDLLYDGVNDVLYLIQHSDRSYLHIDDRVIDEVAALVDSLSGAVGSQQNVLSDLMSTFGVESGEPKKTAAMKKTDRHLTIGGYSCQLFQAHLDGKMQSEMCVSPGNALDLSDADFNTLYNFTRFGARLMNRAGRLLDVLGLTLPPMQLSATDGLPIGMHSPEKPLKVLLKAIHPMKSPAANHGVPEGYRRSAIPFTSG